MRLVSLAAMLLASSSASNGLAGPLSVISTSPRSGPIPLEEDAVEWQSKNKAPKYYLVIGASRTPDPNDDLAFAAGDANAVATAFGSLGFQPLVGEGNAICNGTLIGTEATPDSVGKCVNRINELENSAVILIYYSGHGEPNQAGADLDLQLYGDGAFSSRLAMSRVLDSLKASQGKWIYFILDACNSGGAGSGMASSLSIVDNWVFLSSSRTSRPSAPITLAGGEQRSAFTYYLLRALSDDWDEMDETHDGIVDCRKLQGEIQARLLEAYTADPPQVAVEMEPRCFEKSPGDTFLLYLRDKVADLGWHSNAHRWWAFKWMMDPATLAPRTLMSPLNKDGTAVSVLAPRPIAAALAAQLPADFSSFSETDRVHARALKALAENKPTEALDILATLDPALVGESRLLTLTRARAHEYAGQFDAAANDYQSYLTQTQQVDIVTRVEIVHVFTLAGRKEAGGYATAALEDVRRAGGPLQATLERSLVNDSGIAAFQLGNFTAAGRFFVDAKGVSDPSAFDTAVLLANQGSVAAAGRHWVRAEQFFGVAAEGAEASHEFENDDSGKLHHLLGAALFNQANALENLKQRGAARRIAERAAEAEAFISVPD
jgi:tetratricopeptide (TPR) repeat protein